MRTRLQGIIQHEMWRCWHEIPTVLVSMGQPYFWYDAPRMPCVINAYAPIDTVQEALVARLVGDQPLVGISPVDPFCGLPDARY